MVTYTYDAWGTPLSIGGTMADTLGQDNPLRYRGYVWDSETGLYYLQSRYYDPEVGRFINADVFVATGQGMLGNNMFAYCRNNPVKRKDVSGTEDVCVEDFNEDNNPLNDLGNPSGRGGGGGGGTKSASAGQAPGAGTRSNFSLAQTGSSNASASGNNSSIPKHAWETLDHIKNHNGSPPKGYKGGRPFANDGRNGSARLPDCYAPYREYDVHPKFVGQSRGTERIVIGNGAAFYTPNHYGFFVRME